MYVDGGPWIPQGWKIFFLNKCSFKSNFFIRYTRWPFQKLSICLIFKPLQFDPITSLIPGHAGRNEDYTWTPQTILNYQKPATLFVCKWLTEINFTKFQHHFLDKFSSIWKGQCFVITGKDTLQLNFFPTTMPLPKSIFVDTQIAQSGIMILQRVLFTA